MSAALDLNLDDAAAREKLVLMDTLVQIEDPFEQVWGCVNAIYEALGHKNTNPETIKYLRGQLLHHAYDTKQKIDEQIKLAGG